MASESVGKAQAHTAHPMTAHESSRSVAVKSKDEQHTPNFASDLPAAAERHNAGEELSKTSVQSDVNQNGADKVADMTDNPPAQPFALTNQTPMISMPQVSLPNPVPQAANLPTVPGRSEILPSHIVQFTHPVGQAVTAPSRGSRAMERRNTADYSSSSSDNESDSSGDKKQKKNPLKGLPRAANRNTSFPSRVPLPSRLTPLSPNSPAIQRGYDQIVANYPPPPPQQQRPLSPISPTQSVLAYRPTLRPIQSRTLQMESRPFPQLSLPGLRTKVPSIQPMELRNEALPSSPVLQYHSHGDGAGGVTQQQPSADAVDSPVSQRVPESTENIVTGGSERRQLNLSPGSKQQVVLPGRSAMQATVPSSHSSLGQLLGVGPKHTDPAVVVALTSDSDNPLQFASSEPIHEVARSGNIPELKRQISEFGADYSDHGLRTPLMYAVLGNQKKACRVLLKAGAQINKVDSYGMTALLWAAHFDKPDTLPVLLRYGADVNVCDPSGRTVFHWCAALSGTKCLRLLVTRAAKAIIDEQDKKRLTALHWAVMCEHHSHIRVLINDGHASTGIQDTDGRTPLNYAVLNYSSNCIKAIVECDESAVAVRDNKGRTALHYACGEGNMESIRALMSCPRCDVNCGDNRGTTSLHWAAAGNQAEVIRFLLRRRADKNMMDSSGMTALDHARTRNHSNCIDVLEQYNPLDSPSLTSLDQPAKPIRRQSTSSLGSSIKTKILGPLRSRFSVSSLPASSSAVGSGGSSMTELGDREDGDGSHGDQVKEAVGLPETIAEEGIASGHSGGASQTSLGKGEPKHKIKRRRFMPWLCGSGSTHAVHPFRYASVAPSTEIPVIDTPIQPTATDPQDNPSSNA